jgi:hypothetical protein
MLIEAGQKTALTFYFNSDGVRHSWADMAKKKKRKNNNEKVFVGNYYDMVTWAANYRAHFPRPTYVFISAWEDSEFAYDPVAGKRTRLMPTPEQWAILCKQLHDSYPSAQLGFGEMGAQCYYLTDDRTCVPQEYTEEFGQLEPALRCGGRRCYCCLQAQRDYIERYYISLDRDIRRELGRLQTGLDKSYVGGYFYWHFNDDVLNKFTASKDPNNPEREELAREATDTLNKLISAFRDW